jgi:hypothetical protein
MERINKIIKVLVDNYPEFLSQTQIRERLFISTRTDIIRERLNFLLKLGVIESININGVKVYSATYQLYKDYNGVFND